MKIPDPIHTTASMIDARHEAKPERPRPHMGVSVLGHHCDRWLWLSFRWAVIPRFSGRLLRLFRRGHREEETVVSDLQAIGMEIHSTGGSQSRVDFGCHVSGSMDGIITSGVPESPNKPHILEIKTHSQKSFDDLKNGVKKSKPQHWAQMQVYMLGKKIDRALYFAVNKNTDAIYTERIKLDKDAALKLVERGQIIATSERIPEPCSTDPSWYLCRLCDGHDFCHGSAKIKEVNCRTCAHATAMQDSTWHCAKWEATIPTHAQYDGCDWHVIHPDLVPWQMLDGVDEWTAVYMIDGKPTPNGKDGISSRELLGVDNGTA